MHCEVSWNSLNEQEWQEKLGQVRRSNLLQTIPYARSQRIIASQTMRRGLINIDGKEAGLVMVLDASLLWGLFQAVIIDRGPLWFGGFGSAVHIKLFLEELRLTYPSRFGRKRRFIPEMQDSPALHSMILQSGFEKAGPGYETIWLDLTSGEDTLKAAMKKNWRGALHKAERSEMEIIWDNRGSLLDWFIAGYAADKGDKAYFGLPPQNLHKMARFFADTKSLIIGQSMVEGKPIAGIMLFLHGKSATYQAGWSTDKGRENNAHHRLLWEAVNVLKQQGIEDLDLGGINEEHAQGVTQFKSGLGGQSMRLCGHYK